MSGPETKHSQVAEVLSHQQSDDDDARVLHSLGYNQQLSVGCVAADPDRMCTPFFYANRKLAQIWSVLKLGLDDNSHGNL